MSSQLENHDRGEINSSSYFTIKFKQPGNQFQGVQNAIKLEGLRTKELY